MNSAKVVALKKAATFTGITSIEPTVDEPTLGVGLSGDASMCLPSTAYHLRKTVKERTQDVTVVDNLKRTVFGGNP